MLDSVYVGMTGLIGYSRGLRVISNNVTNLNTPGFKGSQMQFADLFYQGNGGGGGNRSMSQLGNGVNTLATTINFKPGEFRQTGNDLDLAIDGVGFFVLKAQDGSLRFTKAGQFQFNADGVLINRADGAVVMGMDESGQLKEVTLAGLGSNSPSASSSVQLTGNLSSNATTDFVLDGIKVTDPAGGTHTLKMTFKNNNAVTAGSWLVTIQDETGATVSTGEYRFQSGRPVPAFSKLNFTYSPSGVPSFPLSIELNADATSFAAGATSTLAAASVNGYGVGALTRVSFDQSGYLVAAYSNGQTVKRTRLALARFDSTDGLTQIGGNEFICTDNRNLRLGSGGGAFGKINGGMVEISNVDLSQEFSDLIVNQRGFQASSQIVSTANEMIQSLLDMKGR